MAKSNNGTKLGYVLMMDVWLGDGEIYEPSPCGFTFDYEVAQNWASQSQDHTFEVIPIIKKPEKK